MRAVSLTCAETQIFVLFGRGVSVRRIASIRGVSVCTIHKQMERARRKTGAKTSAALAVSIALKRAEFRSSASLPM